MGRLLIEFGIPAALSFYISFKLLKYWYIRFFPKQIKTFKTIEKQSEVYDKMINE